MVSGTKESFRPIIKGPIKKFNNPELNPERVLFVCIKAMKDQNIKSLKEFFCITFLYSSYKLEEDCSQSFKVCTRNNKQNPSYITYSVL